MYQFLFFYTDFEEKPMEVKAYGIKINFPVDISNKLFRVAKTLPVTL